VTDVDVESIQSQVCWVVQDTSQQRGDVGPHCDHGEYDREVLVHIGFTDVAAPVWALLHVSAVSR